MTRYTIICVDDELESLNVINEQLNEYGFDTIPFSSPIQALEHLEKNDVSKVVAIVSDYKMPELNGLEFRAKIPTKFQNIPFLIVSGFITKEMALEGIESRICAFIDKPINFRSFQKCISEETKSIIEDIEEIQEIIQTFINESLDIMEDLEPMILRLEEEPGDIETINTIFRLVHTIKGGSGVIEKPIITNFLHKYEELLASIKNKTVYPDDQIVSILLQAFDYTRRIINSLANSQELPLSETELTNLFTYDASNNTPKQTPTKKQTNASVENELIPESEKIESISVPTNLLDEFMAQSGEITVIRNMVNKLVISIEKKLPADEDVSLLDELLEEMHKINGTIQNQISELRKVPLSQVTKRLPRAIRDTSRKLQKDAVLKISGESLRVDNIIAQSLSNCLIHLIRNAIDHGIERPDQRVKAGKPPQGTISLNCSANDDYVTISIADDGSGINIESIREKLIQTAAKTPSEAAEMTKSELMQQIFASGVSTAKEVTDISGRGVGMDMVKSSINELNGNIDINSEPGQGTEISITLPVPKSVVIISALTVKIGNQTLAIPQEYISRLLTTRTDDPMIHRSLEGDPVIQIDGHLTPIVEAADILGIDRTKPKETISVVLLNTNSTKFGIFVDEILDSEDMVVKELQKFAQQSRAFCGSTFMSDGSIGLILDIPGFAEKARLKNESTIQNVSNIERQEANAQRSLIFGLGTSSEFAVSLDDVFRLEEFATKSFMFSGGVQVIEYRETIMPVVDMATVLKLDVTRQDAGCDTLPVIVYESKSKYVGFTVSCIKDIIENNVCIDEKLKDREGIIGSAQLNDKVVTFLDLHTMFNLAMKHMRLDRLAA